MKTHTSAFKSQIKEFGREIDSIITYTIDEQEIELSQQELNSITPSYEGSILKSVMKQLIIDSNVDVPIGMELNLRFGVKVRDDEVSDYSDNYDYVNFGNYIVKEITKKEDTDSYEIKCYDKMLYSMEEYEMLNITYPITIRNYINAIASKLGLVFKNINDTFPNYDKEVNDELFFSKETEIVEEEGQEPTEKIIYTSLGYTYRDILDQLAQVTASTICINEEDDELELRYINDTEDTINEEYLQENNVNFSQKYGPINSIVLSRGAESDNVYLQDEESVDENGLTEIKIKDNQFMNFDDRETYLQDILDELNGLEYYINEYNSTGIVYYNLCDKYSVIRDNTTYDCIMFNDEILITQGLEENVHTDLPEDSQTDYDKADKTDIKINKAMIIVNKQENEIQSLVQSVNEQATRLTQTAEDFTFEINSVQEQIDGFDGQATSLDTTNDTTQTETKTIVKINSEGINVAESGSTISTQMTNDRFIIQNNGDDLAYFGYDDETQTIKSEIDNLTVPNYFVTGYHRFEKFDIDNEQRTGVFYIGE